MVPRDRYRLFLRTFRFVSDGEVKGYFSWNENTFNACSSDAALSGMA